MELTVIVDGRAGAEPLHGLLGGVIIAGPQWHIACLICRARRINPESDTSALSLVSVAKGKIVRQNRHFQRFSAASFACGWEARGLSFEG